MAPIVLLGYKLLYIQTPFLLTTLNGTDLSRFCWAENDPQLYLSSYSDSVTGQFDSFLHFTRTLTGEEDKLFLNRYRLDSDTSSSNLRMLTGSYSFLKMDFKRRFKWGELGGGIYGTYPGSGPVKGFGTLYFPLRIFGQKNRVNLSDFGGIFTVSMENPYFYFGKTEDNWMGYIKCRNLRFGLKNNFQFINYLFKPINPVFIVYTGINREGKLDNRDFYISNWYVAPVYVLSVNSSIYCVISEKPSAGFKTEHVSLELGEDSYLSFDIDFVSAFITYSIDDSLPRGGAGLHLRESVYYDRIRPGVEFVLRRGIVDGEISVEVLETELFLGMKDIPYGDLYWGVDVDFSF